MNTRILICVAATAAIGAAVGGVTVANASGPSGAPGRPPKSAVSSTSLDPAVAHAAAQLGVTPQQVMRALATVKRAAARYPLSNAHVARALAEQLHVTRAQARRALDYLAIGPDRARQSAAAIPPGWAVNALVAQLHVTPQRARWVLVELDRMSGRAGGVDPESPAFARLSRALGMTPTHLAHALDRWKQNLPASAASASPSAPQPGASPTK